MAADFVDSLQNTSMAAGVRKNALAVLRVAVPVGNSSLYVSAASSIFGAPTDPGIGVYVDGTFSTTFQPTANLIVQPFYVALDASIGHTVELWESYQGATGTTIDGTFIHNVAGTGVSLLGDPAPARRLVIYGDSIVAGYAAVPDTQNSWAALMRHNYPGRLSLEAWGARALWDDNGAGRQGFANMDLLTSRLVGLFFGATTRQLWIAMGTNDFGANQWNSTSFGTALASLLDKVHVADATISIFVQSPFITTTPAATNSFGEVIATYRTAAQTACSGRAWVTFVDGFTVLTTGDLQDTVHPSTAGHLKAYNAFKVVLGGIP